ncbi:hypothetical protein FRC04_011353 [Tulasnella sp. 424]|nr:hypothetical protein FRC04_011353 [Tulasnella sp. 424]KAG8975478.1 hypothetical protein FRC05_005547 [Tulasnella sp. 425]
MASHSATPTIYNQSRKPGPDYNVPPKLVTFILELHFPESNDFRTRGDMVALYDLRLVSRLWKELIEDTPTLWTHISADDFPTTVIRDCLRWSKSRSLRISVGFPWTRCSETRLIKHLDLLRLHSHRWKTLSYSAKRLPSIDDQHVKNFLESPAPMLQSIYASFGFGDEPAPTFNLAGGQAKALKHLSLHDVLVPWSSNLLPGLESFDLGMHSPIPAEEIFNLLTKSPALKSLDLFWEDAESPNEPNPLATPPPDITAASLEEVSIDITSFQFTSHILSHVSMPSCESLELCARFTTPGDLDVLGNALVQFMPRITEALRLAGRTRLIVQGAYDLQWRSSLDYKAFQFVFIFSGLLLESLIGWIRNLVATSESQLEVEVILDTSHRQTVEALGDWNDITNLMISHPVRLSTYGTNEDVSLPDFLGDVRVDPVDGLSWPFPNLQELVLFQNGSYLLAVLGMLNRRYLPDSYVRELEGQGISVSTPPPIAIDLRVESAKEDDATMAVLKNHRGVKRLNHGELRG